MKTPEKLTENEKKSINNFLFFNDKMNYRKLSDFYHNRTTKYNSCFDSDLFEKTNDKDAILLAGFRNTVKTIICLNLKNKKVKTFLKSLKEAQKKAKKIADANAKKLQEDIKNASLYITENKDYIETRNAVLKTENISGMDLKPIAYWLSQKNKTISTQGFLNALRNIYQK